MSCASLRCDEPERCGVAPVNPSSRSSIGRAGVYSVGIRSATRRKLAGRYLTLQPIWTNGHSAAPFISSSRGPIFGT